jgi:hypothetical protein
LYRKDEYVPHKKVWTLDLTKKVWEDNRCPEIPTPRWNAALSEVVTTKEEIIDNENKPTGRFKTVSRVFLIGGRIDNRSVEKVEIKDDNGNVTKKYHKLVIKQGLTGSIEAYNVNTNTWETDFPHL